jgi:K+-sensing histidine kinase KdpD
MIQMIDEIETIGTNRNITGRKKTEQKLNESEEKYRNAYSRMVFLQKLIAHDIKNVLNSINSLQYQGSLYNNNEEVSKILERINEVSQKGGILIDNVRKLSFLESSKIILKKVEVNKILNNSINFVYSSFPALDIKINVKSWDKTLYVQANGLLSDVFDNILLNGVKHNDNSRKEILIKISRCENYNKDFLKFELIDNGRGIPDNKKQLLLQKNFKKEMILNKGGLGLILVNFIIKIYSGYIWIEDKVKGNYSKGTNIIILIPEAKC